MASAAAPEIEVGDITKMEVTAIVNAANERLAPGGGVCGAIFRAAGAGLIDECQAYDGCPTGEARITGGYNLPAAWIIHAVGPVWHGGDEGEPELLANCYRNALALAAEYRMESIAFPAISTGIFGYPPEEAAKVAAAACREHAAANEYPKRILLVAFDEAQAEPLRRALGDWA
ncbi:macro domain-containing protein [Parvibaculum sp.]|jgi:O-acetyl-ADP-ribose deacetylase (regulator of RNase III)|uniref:macro domain-containing protein n=2 Tax=Parvibaculum sp. TaxID=2024848 RepID=UPI001B10AA0A|nr:macro domain-containing protein [Parvibaculum sp.]MBO6634634.1 macro domain-containing protein [Parvibaculum sp.]MBO6678360.1 macro domain-containing protein [Parvibaculum sp.]MBO6903691.1 macro domain-containing protein [Parvibaculum sp.]